jgi:hypothetical protein
MQAPGGISLNLYANASSGRPFNITLGRDLNEDALFAERPAFATDLMNPEVVLTPFGPLDPNPSPSQSLIPRNYGTGPAQFSVGLQVSKSVKFGNQPAVKNSAKTSGTPNEKRYRLSFSLQAENLLNHTNLAVPVGNLSSPFFGRSTSALGPAGGASAGNRRIEAQVAFSF